MKTILEWNRSGRRVASGLAMFAALAAFVLFAGTPIATAQMQAPEAPGFGSPWIDGGEFEIEIEGDEFGDFDEFGDGPLAMHGPSGPDMAPMHDNMGGGGGGIHGRMGARRAEMMEKLNLTAKQKDQMADLRDAQDRKMIGIKSGLAEARLDMKKLMRADSPSQAQIDATIDRMAKLRADAAKSRVATRLAMRGLLTDTQQKTMDEMRGGKMRGAAGAPRGGGGAGSGKRGA